MLAYTPHSQVHHNLSETQSSDRFSLPSRAGQWGGTSVSCCSCCLWIVCNFPFQVSSSHQCQWNIIKRLVYRTFSLIQSLSSFPETSRHDRVSENVVDIYLPLSNSLSDYSLLLLQFIRFQKIKCHLMVYLSSPSSNF